MKPAALPIMKAPATTLVWLVIILNAVAILCFAVGTWLAFDGYTPIYPVADNWFKVAPPNVYGDWPVGLLLLAILASLLALPANIMFMIRVRHPRWLYIPTALTTLFSICTFTFVF